MAQTGTQAGGDGGETAVALPDSAVLELLAAASDLVLVLASDGTCVRVVTATAPLQATALVCRAGLSLVEAVLPDSEGKATLLLDPGQPARAREINLRTLPGPDGSSPPAVPVRAGVRWLAGVPVLVGRDLSALAEGHVRLAEAALASARELDGARQAAARLRRIVSAAPVALLVADPVSRRIVEANPAAAALLGQDPAGLSLTRLVADADTLAPLLEGSAGRVAAATPGGEPVWISLERVRDGRRILAVLVLVPREAAPATRQQPAAAPAAPAGVALLGAAFLDSPVPLLVADAGLRVRSLNAASLELFQCADPGMLAGRPLGELVGRSGADAQVLGANLRDQGRIAGFMTLARTGPGALEPVELSAAALPGRDGFVLALRLLPPRPGGEAGPEGAPVAGAARTPQAMVGLIGQIPLKDIVRDSADVIEQMCIEAALDLTGGNRASAAEMLGLSRQSLYTKLHRLGLFGAEGTDGADGPAETGP